MESTATYHHYRTDLKLYNVLPNVYIEPTTTYHQCRTDLQLYNFYNIDILTVLQPIITEEQIYRYTTFDAMGIWKLL